MNPVNFTKTAQLHNPLGRHPESQELSTDRPGRRSGQRSTGVEITQQARNPRETLARHGENEVEAFRAAGTRARGRLSPPRRKPSNDPFEDGGDQNGDRCNSDPASGRLHVRRSWGEADGRPEGLTASPGQAYGSACRQPDGAWRVSNQHRACPWRPARRSIGGDGFNCPYTAQPFRPHPVPSRRRERELEPKAGEGGCRRGCPRPVPHSRNPGDRHARPRTRYL